jgi:hypothetical protein
MYTKGGRFGMKRRFTMGDRTELKRGTIKHEHGCLLHADDTVLFFNTRDDLEKGAGCLYAHHLKFGLTMHIGIGATPSKTEAKTEAMFFPPPRRLYSDADTSGLGVVDYLSNAVGSIDFTTEFKYLGSFVHHSLTSDADVDKRIRSASAAFGALKNIPTNKDIILKVKGSVYEALCLSILLYGSEIRCLREDFFNCPRHFHHRCARTMYCIAIAHAIRHHISSASLFKCLSIKSFDTYYNRRILRWTGHVARMPLRRAPRKILTSWVDNPRPHGCPQINWGRTLIKAL